MININGIELKTQKPTHIYIQLIFNNGAMTIKWEKHWICTCKKMKLDTNLTP